MNDITERVERGAALLDEKWPLWWRDVSLKRLDLSSPCNCVAGQLHGGDGYTAVMDTLGLTIYDEAEHGFEADDHDDEGYGRLTEAWRELITRRREMASVTA